MAEGGVDFALGHAKCILLFVSLQVGVCVCVCVFSSTFSRITTHPRARWSSRNKTKTRRAGDK